MNDRDNYYILLGLDPSVRDEASIAKAIKNKQAEWSRDRNNPTKAVEAKRNMSKLKDIEIVLKDPQKRNDEAENAKKIKLAEEKKNHETLRMRAFVVTENEEISELELSKLAKDFKLTEAEVLKIINAKVKKEEVIDYKDDGIPPLDKTVAKNIRTSLDIIKKEDNITKEYKPKDLFEFLGCATTASCTKLLERADEIYSEASRNSNKTAEIDATITLAGLCKKWLKDDNVKGMYEKTLRLEALDEVYNMVDLAASDGIIDAQEYQKLIKACTVKGIKVNEAEFRIHEYCKEKKFPPPIRTENAEYKKQIQCGICGHLNDKSAVNCGNCGNSMKIICPKCGKEAASASKACSGCGFSIGDMPSANPLIRNAKVELSRKNFKQARDLLAEAEAFNPKHPDIEKIKEELKKEEDTVKKINALFAKNNFVEAQTEIAKLKIINPNNAGVSEYEKKAEERIAAAGTLCKKAGVELNLSKKLDMFLTALDECADFSAAITGISSVPVNAPTDLAVTKDKSTVILNWRAPKEGRGLKYKVVRKENSAPANPDDDEILAETETLSWRDDKPVPDKWYGYSVFAIRYVGGKRFYSPPVNTSFFLQAEVSNVHHKITDSGIYITWNKPKNSSGVTVSRALNGKEIVLKDNAQTSIEDTDIKYGMTYTYTFCANYTGMSSSDGVKIDITPMEKLDDFEISVEQVKGNKYKVTWNINRPNIDMRILVNEMDRYAAKSDKGEYEIELPRDGLHVVKVKALSGSESCMSKNSVHVNTYSSCEIDKTVSLIEKPIAAMNGTIYNIELPIKISSSIPNNAVAFLYTVRTKSSHDKSEPWTDVNEIAKAQDIIKVSVDSYKKNGMILYSDRAKDTDAYYVTIFTVYSINGKEVVSAPCKQSFSRMLKASIIWKVSKPLFRKGSLYIEVESNYPFMRVPKLILCASQDKRIESYKNANVKILDEIPEKRFSIPQKNYKDNKEINPEKLSKIDKNWNLFLLEANPVANEKFIFCWGKEFSGKI